MWKGGRQQKHLPSSLPFRAFFSFHYFHPVGLVFVSILCLSDYLMITVQYLLYTLFLHIAFSILRKLYFFSVSRMFSFFFFSTSPNYALVWPFTYSQYKNGMTNISLGSSNFMKHIKTSIYSWREIVSFRINPPFSCGCKSLLYE